eukprot:CAMPEP_0170141772 /NCGR_PEP_ID=MMETSP0033_2-20121228/7217_1 /TAXON_ID=195969 /ORGANISM="Dolichomastix tenuilepis, Strain CCMP3274" /LENGTH=142 /DNA_ID=CAMNT_0010378059 /DNA_START=26 /DNA_END=454 /DNA_ORIENTATION=+
MSAVERVGWMDSQASNFLREMITKEEKFQEKFIDVDGLPDIEEPTASGPEPVPMPPKVDPDMLSAEQAERKLGVELSKNMWRRCNPGYNFGSSMGQSVTSSDYNYDPEELEPCDKTNFRRRDGFTMYVEASSRFKLLTKKGM